MAGTVNRERRSAAWLNRQADRGSQTDADLAEIWDQLIDMRLMQGFDQYHASLKFWRHSTILL
jgi:hypothetical protein